MKKEKATSEMIKGFITGSIMATTDIMVQTIIHPIYTHEGKAYRIKLHPINNFEAHITGLAIGYSVGKRVADDVVSGFEAAVAAYKGEEIVDG